MSTISQRGEPWSAPILLEEGDDWFAVNKPHNMHVESKIPGDNTLATWVLQRFPEARAASPKEFEAGACHRLDYATGGIVVHAKTTRAWQRVHQGIRTHKAEKHYVVKVYGDFPRDLRAIDYPVGHPKKRNARKMIAVKSRLDARLVRSPQAARTVILNVKYDQTLDISELRVALDGPGRRHQLRVHMAAVGNPIVNDPLYASKEALRLQPKALAQPMMLFATYFRLDTIEVVCEPDF